MSDRARAYSSRSRIHRSMIGRTRRMRCVMEDAIDCGSILIGSFARALPASVQLRTQRGKLLLETSNRNRWNGTKPTRSSLQSGMTSRSNIRSIIEYSLCTAVSGVTACGRRICSAAACDCLQPRIFPSLMSLPMLSASSSTGMWAYAMLQYKSA